MENSAWCGFFDLVLLAVSTSFFYIFSACFPVNYFEVLSCLGLECVGDGAGRSVALLLGWLQKCCLVIRLYSCVAVITLVPFLLASLISDLISSCLVCGTVSMYWDAWFRYGRCLFG